MNKHWLRLWGAVVGLCWSVNAAAATLLVQPGDSLVQVLSRAADGDTVHIAPGDHRGQVAVIEHKRLTLRGLPSAAGARPVLHAQGRHAEGKAILVVRNGDVLIENIEFRGARVPDGNGAGIRFERGRLVVSRCAFFDNQNGLLTGNQTDAELRIEDSEFGAAPAGSQLPHLLYVGRIARFSLSGSRLSGGRSAHLVKSRARENHIHGNQLVDGEGGSAAYELEFPNGGLAWVVGNVIAQSADTSNSAIVSFGAEGAVDDREQGLFVAHNTLVNHALRPAVFVRMHNLERPVEHRFVNNLMVGLGLATGTGTLELADLTRGNFTLPVSALPGAERGDYALAADSWLRGRGVPPGSARGVSLMLPSTGPAPSIGTRARTDAQQRWSPGAQPH